MKNIVFLIILLVCINVVSYAYSDSFEYMLDVMGMEIETENGHKINEEMFNAYNQFVYGNPLLIKSGQRWKNVNDGRWTKNGGIWSGTGTRGEYWVLGYNISEDPIHNHKFPVDKEPPTSPIEWRYVYLPEAEGSWINSELYRREEQKTYMLTTKLTRNNVTYDLTALDIGLDRAKVENYATWKTEGNIYTRRYDINNQEWAANFIVPPMAGNAELKAELKLPDGDEYEILEDEDSIIIPIEYGCEVIKLTDFAKKEHVKEIASELVLDERKVDVTKESKETELRKMTQIIINKNDYPNQSSVEISLSCKSHLLTEFTVDGALTDVVTKKIYIEIAGVNEPSEQLNVKDENKNYEIDAVPPIIDSVEIGRYTSSKTIPLNTARKTGTEFICAGHTLVINVKARNTDYITLEFAGDSSIVTLDETTKRFEWVEPRERNVKTKYSTLKELQNAYKKRRTLFSKEEIENTSYFEYRYVIPYETKQTLNSWSTLRNKSGDAFNIEDGKLFSRIISPYEIVIKAHSDDGVRTKRIKLDVFERWDTLYNRDLSPYIK